MPNKGVKNVEAVFPLTPMQEGMLFHSLYEPEAGLYVEQIRLSLEGRLDEQQFKRAWEKVVLRHPPLRTLFLWKKQKQALQVVRRQVDLDWTFVNAREKSHETCEALIQKTSQESRVNAFNLSKAPLSRWHLIQTGDEKWEFVWTWHHAILDGWSVSLILKDASQIYSQQQTDHPDPSSLTDSAPAQFRDYVQWLQNRDSNALQDYWAQRLADLSEVTRLPLVSSAQTNTGQTAQWDDLFVTLDEPHSEAIAAFARRHRVTANTLLQGAWALAMSWFSQNRNVLYGVTISGRPPLIDGIESMTGLFINTIPALTHCADSDRLEAWLQQLQSTNLQSEENGFLPLSNIKALAAKKRSDSVFESLFVFENYPTNWTSDSNTNSLQVRNVETFERTNFPLNVIATTGSTVKVRFLYDRRVIDPSSVQTLSRMFQQILTRIPDSAGKRLAELKFLPDEEQAELAQASQEHVSKPSARNVLDLIRKQLPSTKHQVAVTDEALTLSYERLDQMTSDVACALVENGVQAEDRIAILLPRSADLVIAEWASLKSGGAFVPIDPNYPDERIRHILTDSGTKICLGNSETEDRLRSLAEEPIRVLSLTSLLEQKKTESIGSRNTLLPFSPDPDQIAYLVYTSGSTGRPKGVMITHGGLVNLVDWHLREYQLEAKDHGPLLAGVGFDASIWEIWPTLCAGATIHPIPHGMIEDSKRLIRWLSTNAITVSFLPTPIANVILASDSLNQSALRLLLTGGDRLLQRPSEGLKARVVNNYGPSENTVVATFGTVHDHHQDAPLPSIGRPVDNVTIRVLNDRFEEIPHACPGELFIGGKSLSRGYNFSPGLTAERFLPAPSPTLAGERVYRTGDCVRFIANHDLEFIGRLDEQVQIRGYRVELGEIEAVLCSHAEISDALVTLAEGANQPDRLIAYYIGAPNPQLKDWLTKRLPAYMLPSGFVALDAFPQTPNGKIDRQALPLPTLAGSHRAYRAPRSAQEEIIVEIWADVLSHPGMSIDEDFFELGGHSLLATQIISRVNETLGIDLPIKTLFEHSTPESFSAALSTSRNQSSDTSISKVPPISTLARSESGSQLHYPLSYAQDRIWFLNELEECPTNYNIVQALSVFGPLDRERFERAFLRLIARHESLRTTFQEHQGQPCQLIQPPPRTLDIEHRTIGESVDQESLANNQALSDEIALEAAIPFNLTTGPLIRLRWIDFQGAAGDHRQTQVLLICLHHIIADGWSMGVMVTELQSLYDEDRREGSVALKKLRVQCVDHATWQREQHESGNWQAHLDYWRTTLSGVPRVIDFPFDRPRHATASNAGSEIRFNCSKKTNQALKELSRKRGVSLFMTLQAAFTTFLARITGQTDLVIGNPIANRSGQDVEALIGCFVNLLPIRVKVTPDQTFFQLLETVRESCLQAYAHQDAPFEVIINELGVERNLAIDPLVQVAFTFQNLPNEEFSAPETGFRPIHFPSKTAKFDLELEMFESKETLVGRFEFRTDLFNQSTVQHWVDCFELLLDAIAQAPKEKLQSYPLINSETSAAIQKNLTGVASPKGPESYIEAVDLIAAKYPQRIAALDSSGTLSYQELIQSSRRIAAALRGRGIGTNSVVALLIDRSNAYLAAVLGTLRAGAAFLPMDAAHPTARMKQVLTESKAAILLVGSENQRKGNEVLQAVGQGLELLSFEEANAGEKRPDKTSYFTPAAPGDLAYIIYTSGSTGTPKGAMVEHGGMLNHLAAKIEDLGLTEADVISQNASQCFDISVWQFLTLLLVGGKVRIYEDDVAHDPSRLFIDIARDEITILEIVPSVLRVFLNEVERTQERPQLPSLRWMIPTGEAFPMEQAAHWFRLYPGIQAVNAYGPSECSDDVTHHILSAAPDPREASIPIGQALRHTRLSVRDPFGTIQPIGVYGELFVGGTGVGRGYIGRPELTAERFLPDPSSDNPGHRIYRTGDRVRADWDGVLHFAGRLDHQVKIRGFRIELEEIEAVINRVPGVHQAATKVCKRSSGEEGIFAYYTADTTISSSIFNQHLESTLPSYCLPESYTHLDTFPLSSAGKVNRKALPEPELEENSEEPLSHPPKTLIERAIASIWETVLGIDKVGIQSNFFEIGGHSLLATQVVSRIRTDLAIELRVREIFENPTIHSLSQILTAKEANHTSDSSDHYSEQPIPTSHPSPDVPLSFAQERMWFLENLEGSDGAYNITRAVRLQGSLNRAALLFAYRELLKRHEILRSTIDPTGPFLRFQEAETMELPIDWQRLEGELSSARLNKLLLAEARLGFSLESSVPIRLLVLETAQDDHTLTLTVHHSAADGWSLNLIINELNELYSAAANEQLADLAELPIQYRDYTHWQRQTLSNERLAALKTFWRTALDSAPGELELPFDKPRPARQTFSGQTQSFTIGAETTNALKELSQETGATLFMLLNAAYAVLLSRLSGSHDITIGTPVSGRNRTEFQPLVGCFLNTLPIRLRFNEHHSFRDLIDSVRETVLDAFSHETLPFEQILESLNVERSLGHHPLFQAMFILQPPAAAPLRFDDIEVTPIPFDSGVSRMDMTMSAEQLGDELHCLIESNADLFEAASVERFIGYYQQILKAFTSNSEARLHSFQLVNNLGPNQAFPYQQEPQPLAVTPKGLLEALSNHSRTAADRIAVSKDATNLSYGALERRSTALAEILNKNYKLPPEARIGVCLDRSLDMIVTLIAIWKVAGVYVPLDPAFPIKRLKGITEDAAPSLVITQSEYAESWIKEAAPKRFLNLDQLRELDTPDRTTANCVSRGFPLSDSLAYILYTSGSTGKPKGVGVSHRAMMNFIRSMALNPAIDTQDRLLAVTTLSFDISVLELFVPIFQQARIFLASREDILDGKRLLNILQRDSITTMQATPATWQLLLEAEWQNTDNGSLKALCGGEALSKDLARQLNTRCDEVWNMYGPTETTVWSAIHRVEDSDLDDASPSTVSIGSPILNTDIQILAPAGHANPIGVFGELYIGGDGVARGYENRPDLTAERFLPCPTGPHPGARWYRTGDKARLCQSMTHEFVGRIDHQVKVRGFRIELGEIEAALRSQNEIEEAIVLPFTDHSKQTALAAHVILATTSDETDLTPDFDTSKVLQSLREILPDYMIPAHITSCDSFPRLPNGKINRAGFDPIAKNEGSIIQGSVATPETDLERRLLDIWETILGQSNIGVDQDFFASGGHSLMIMRFANRIRKDLSLNLPIISLFETPTIRQIARKLDEDSGSTKQLPLVTLDKSSTNTETVSPLSHQQQRLWFLYQLDPSAPTYNMAEQLQWDGALNAQALKESFLQIVERHAILRSTYSNLNGVSSQTVHPLGPNSLSFEEEHLEELSSDEVEAQYDDFINRPFDLTTGPLIRVRISHERKRTIVLFCIHHIATDGWSTGILFQEIQKNYQAAVNGSQAESSRLSIQYADYVRWQRQFLSGSAADKQLSFWIDLLSDAPTQLNLPTDYPRPPKQLFKGATRYFRIDSSLIDRLHTVAKQQKVTVFSIWQSAFSALLSRYSGDNDIVTGTPMANRRMAEFEPLIGFFVNTVPVRLRELNSRSFYELIRHTNETMTQIMANQDLPFERLLEKIQPERDLSRMPLFQVLFVLQNHELARSDQSSISVQTIEVTRSVSAYDLTLAIRETTEGAIGAIEFNTDLFQQERIDQFIQHFQTFLERALIHPNEPCDRICFTSTSERARILEFSAGPKTSLHETSFPHRLIEETAARTPARIAVALGETSLSYGELNRRANQLAQALLSNGIQYETAVGVGVSRSFEMIIAVLGILKAGGQYVPLNPKLPQERLQTLITNSRIEWVITRPSDAAAFAFHDEERLLPILLERSPSLRNLENPILPGHDPEHLAYTIYTSGTTGKPKGVEVSHRSLNNLVQETLNSRNLQTEARVLQLVSLSFDPCTAQIFSTLCNAATLVLAPESDELTGTQWAKLLHFEAISNVTFPSPILSIIPKTKLPALQSLITGGEAVSSDLAKYWASQCRFFNEYGPTETTVCATFEECRSSDRDPSIGGPIRNVTCYVVDATVNLVPDGITGELMIGGEGLARAYTRNPYLSAAAFMPDPFATSPGERMYRSGDLVRRRADGTLEFIGRKDNQVKLRGYRIELGEVESALKQCSDVAQATVILKEQSGIKQLIAYVVRERSIDLETIKSELLRKLPHYMVPSKLIALEKLPLTPNNKIDYRALPDPASTKTDELIAPETNTEKALASVWKELLHRDVVGVHENFFELGGDSIQSIQVVSRIQDLGYKTDVQSIFEHQTIAGLAKKLRPISPLTSQRYPVVGSAPLSPIQCWFRSLKLKNPNHWNQALLFTTPTQTVYSLIEATVRVLLEQHDALRLKLPGAGKLNIQSMDELPDYLPLSHVAVGETDDASFAETVEQTVELAHSKINLDDGPLLNITYLSRAGNLAGRILFVIHHAAIDGVSWRLLLKDFESIYSQLASGDTPKLPPKTASYLDWTEALNSAAYQHSILDELPFWIEMSTTSSTFSAKEKLRASQRSEVKNITRSIESATIESIRATPSSETRITVYEALVTAIVRSASQFDNEESIVIDLESHGRSAEINSLDISGTIGWFTSLYPVRFDLKGASKIEDLLVAVQTQLNKIPNLGINYGVLRYLSAHGEPLNQAATPRIGFNYLGQFDHDQSEKNLLGPAPESAGASHLESEDPVHQIEINCSLIDGTLHVSFAYDASIVTQASVEKMADTFESALEELAEKIHHIRRASVARQNAAESYSLTPLQQSMLRASQRLPGTGVYLVQQTIDLAGDLDTAIFKSVWETLLGQHSQLRVRILNPQSETPSQAPFILESLPWSEHDWSNLNPQDAERRYQAFLKEDLTTDFEIDRSQLVRFTLIKTAGQTWHFVWTGHHIIADGWSAQIILAQATALYRSTVAQGMVPSLDPSISFQAHLDRCQAGPAATAEAQSFWEHHYEPLQNEALPLPHYLTLEPPAKTTATKVKRQLPRFTSLERHLSEEVTSKLNQWARKHKTTPSVLFQTCWARTLAELSGNEEIVFGITISGRERNYPGIERVVGPLLNIHPIRIVVDDSTPISQSVQTITAIQADILNHSRGCLNPIGLPFDSSRISELESVLFFENYPTREEGSDAKKTLLKITNTTIAESNEFPLSIFISPAAQIHLKFVFDSQKISESKAQHLASVIEKNLTTMLRPETS